MEQGKCTALVGGSFDPVHWGHLHLVHTVVAATAYRRFIFVPVGRNNFKQELAPPIDAEHRVKMLKLGLDAYTQKYPDDPHLEFIIDECELHRPGISYTYDTVLYLYKQYAITNRLALVMGDDLLLSLKQWYEYDTLKKLVRFVVIQRERQSRVSFVDDDAQLLYLQNPLFVDSSTMIRTSCKQIGKDEQIPSQITGLMPEEVAKYVQRHRLYRS